MSMIAKTFMGNVWSSNIQHVRQAAIDTKMPVLTGEAKDRPSTWCIGVYTEQPELNHGPFWQRYFELSRKVEKNDQKRPSC